MTERKSAARDALRRARDGLSETERTVASERIADTLAALLGGRRTVMVFLSFGSEVPTDPICDRLAFDHDLVVPHIDAGELVPVAYVPGEATVQAVWGIREPASLRPVAEALIDAVVAPGLGFDRRGFRLGYGGGYYDRLLSRCRPDALRIGIGFHCQLVDEIPHDEHDEPMQVIVTDGATIEV